MDGNGWRAAWSELPRIAMRLRNGRLALLRVRRSWRSQGVETVQAPKEI